MLFNVIMCLVECFIQSVLFFSLAIFFFHPIYYLRPSILSLLVVTQIRGHIAGSSPPLPTTVRALYFYREKISALSSLVYRIYSDTKLGCSCCYGLHITPFFLPNDIISSTPSLRPNSSTQRDINCMWSHRQENARYIKNK